MWLNYDGTMGLPSQKPASQRVNCIKSGLLRRQPQHVVKRSVGPRSSTGYSLRVQRVVERRRGIYVYLRELTPSLGDPLEPRVTYPYRAIAIAHSSKPIYVKLQGRP